MATLHVHNDIVNQIYNTVKSKIYADIKDQILDDVYPVGSVALFGKWIVPDNVFGGTWQQYYNGFIWCTHGDNEVKVRNGSTDSQYTNSPEAQSHKLTVSELPAHNHLEQLHIQNVGTMPMGGGSSGTSHYELTSGAARGRNGTSPGVTADTGSGYGHTHDINYIGCNFWVRIA